MTSTDMLTNSEVVDVKNSSDYTLNGVKKVTALQASEILEYPHGMNQFILDVSKHGLENNVTMDKSGVVTVCVGETIMTFGSSHEEAGYEPLLQQPYSKGQLNKLVALFGKRMTPYIDLLGMRANINYGQEKDSQYKDRRYNAYWSSTISGNDGKDSPVIPYGLIFLDGDVSVGLCNPRDGGCIISTDNN